MTFHRIPVRLIASDLAEIQAFSDILAGNQTDALALAESGEAPMAALVCPSGDPIAAGDLPTVVLGARRDGVSAAATVLSIPADLSDILAALEGVVRSASNLNAARDYLGWMLDPARLFVRTPDDQTIALTDTEARILVCLFDADGAEVSRDLLLQRVWGYRPGLDTHTVETHIYRLRQKIEAEPTHPRVLLTTPDGYRFTPN